MGYARRYWMGLSGIRRPLIDEQSGLRERLEKREIGFILLSRGDEPDTREDKKKI